MNQECESLVKFLKIASQQYKEGKHISADDIKEKLKKLLDKTC